MGDFKYHTPVLADEVIRFLKDVNIKKESRVFVDATCGTGGHSELLLRNIKQTDVLIGVDIDPEILGIAIERLIGFKNFFTSNKNYTEIRGLLKTFGLEKVDGIVIDLGACACHYSFAYRGFSIMQDSVLDMRYNKESRLSAWDVVNTFSYEDLAEIIRKFGEERWSNRIAQKVVEARKIKSIDSTKQLAEIISNAIPRRAYPKKIHPAAKSFQAIRIFINKELKNLEYFLRLIPDILANGGRVVTISFHSLEDRLIKEAFKRYSRKCVCPEDFPVCKCGGIQRFCLVNKKPIKPSDEEKRNNPSSRSAKLRVLGKISS